MYQALNMMITYAPILEWDLIVLRYPARVHKDELEWSGRLAIFR